MSRETVASLVFCVCLLAVSVAWAQTPFDTGIMSLKTFAILIASTMIIFVGIIIGLMMIGALHLGPSVLMWVVFGCIGIFVIGAAASGQLNAWVGAPL